MTESEIHYFIKNKIAQALTELGFETKTEETLEYGRVDVSARRDNEHIKIEVIKTHTPDWFAVKLSTNTEYGEGMKALYQNEFTNMRISEENWKALRVLGKIGESLDDVLTRILNKKEGDNKND